MPAVSPAPLSAYSSSIAFLDESGAISHDRFFAVGCLKLAQPCDLTRAIITVRDKLHWYHEIHFTDLTRASLPFYREVLRQVCSLRATFACFVADREQSDPVARFGNAWTAYERLAEQLIVGNIRRRELVTVLADSYSTPPAVAFEVDLKRGVIRRLGESAVTSVCRLDSRSADPLQVVDFLTGAVTFEFRQQAGLAGTRSPKAVMAAEVRSSLGAGTFLQGFRSPSNSRFLVNVALYGQSPAPGKVVVPALTS